MGSGDGGTRTGGGGKGSPRSQLAWTFAPMLDIARDARWGRIVEGAGEDTYLGAAVAAAQVRGFQGDYLGMYGIIWWRALNTSPVTALPMVVADFDPVYL